MTCTWNNTTGSVSVRNGNACGQSASLSKTVTVSACMELLDENEMTEELELIAYPNPSRGPITITSDGYVQARIYNSLGQELESFQLNEGNGFTHNLLDLPAGMYFLQDVNADRPPIRLIQLR